MPVWFRYMVNFTLVGKYHVVVPYFEYSALSGLGEPGEGAQSKRSSVVFKWVKQYYPNISRKQMIKIRSCFKECCEGITHPDGTYSKT